MSNRYLILTDKEILTPNTEFIYYCIWYRFTLVNHTFNITRALREKNCYITHNRVERFNKKEIGEYCGEILWNTLCSHLNRFKNTEREEKRGEFLLVIPFAVADYVMQAIMKSGLKPQAWSGHFRQWCYYYWMSSYARSGAARISQSGGAEKMGITKRIFNETTLDLMKLGLIERCGNYNFGSGSSHGYSYKIPKSIEVLNENDWNLE